MEKMSTTTKMIELKNGYVEIITTKNEDTLTNDPTFYSFLAKLLVEDKNLQIKNEGHSFKD